MLEKPAITFVRDTEFLGPLTLDRLYRSGFAHFPVIDVEGRIVGTLSTEDLNSLAIKEADRAFKYVDPKVFYLNAEYTLEMAVAAFIRTNAYFFMVVDEKNEIVGLLTMEMIFEFLVGKVPKDNFDKDYDRGAVARRKG